MIEGVLDQLSELGTGWLLVASFLLPFGETLFLLEFVVPGEVGLVVVGASRPAARLRSHSSARPP